MRFFKIVLLSSICLINIIACKKDDEMFEPTPPIPFAQQEETDNKNILKFFAEYTMKVTGFSNDNNNANDYEVTFEKIPTPNPDSIISIYDKYRKEIEKPKIVNIGGVDHKCYYITFEKGSNLQPSRVDDIFASYKGYLLDNTSFDESRNPVLFNLFQTGSLNDVFVEGWREIFPLFKTGFPTLNNDDGTTSYKDFGAGVMFLPSALAYYEKGSRDGSIPPYSPLIFSFKLFQLNYIDYDGDGILSKDEDINGDGLFNNDDTDGDGIQNFLDVDDDGDGYLTKSECKYTYIENGVTKTRYYPFKGAKLDDPLTFYDETKGVPSCSGDFTSDGRTRRYLDKNCYKD